MAVEITACPHCGSESYYRRVRFHGYGKFYYNFDGTEDSNEMLHHNLNYDEQKTMYCADCDKAIGSATTKGK